jgi:hypothetical protein
MNVESFYGTVTTVSLALLGLWWVVLQVRNELWRSRSRKQLAYAVTLQFLLPGLMAILSLVAPDQALIWRWTLVVAGLCGIASTVLLLRGLRGDAAPPPAVRYFQWLSLPAYAIVVLIAAVPVPAGTLPLALSPIQIEGIALILILFLGAMSATVLLVEENTA